MSNSYEEKYVNGRWVGPAHIITLKPNGKRFELACTCGWKDFSMTHVYARTLGAEHAKNMQQ